MSLSAALFAALTLQTGAPEITAEEALRRSMERAPLVNVDAIIEQAAPWGGEVVRLRMWRDVQGRRRTEILSPINRQRQTSVDAGKTWTTYFPDDKKIRIHPSPMSEPDDLDFRMRLIRKNYRLEIDSKTTIAGRAAIRVVARPKWANGLETRRFYLDAVTYVSLKMETEGADAPTYNVRRISFPARFERSTFDPPQGGSVKLDLASPPLRLKDVDDAERRLGFRPAAPRRLPMGFQSQGMALWDWRGVTPVQTRLTDGLVKINVYQFRIPTDRPAPPPRPGDDRKSARNVGDIRIEVRGDVPASVREKILGIYASKLSQGQKAQATGDDRNPSARLQR